MSLAAMGSSSFESRRKRADRWPTFSFLDRVAFTASSACTSLCIS